MGVSTFAKAVNYNDLLPPIILTAPHTAGATTLVLPTGAGARLGTLPADRVFRVTALQNPDTPAESVLGVFKATGIAGDTLTGLSGDEGFGNVALAAGATIQVRMTAREYEDHSAAINTLESDLDALSLHVDTIIPTPGPPGPQGPPGPPGASNARYTQEWNWRAATSGDPGSGKVSINTNSWATATQMFVADVTATGFDFPGNEVKVGDDIHIQIKNNADNWAQYDVIGVTNLVTYMVYDIVFIDSGGLSLPGGNTRMSISVLTAGATASYWYNGTGVPNPATGRDGDYYLNDTNGDVYAMTGGAWAIVSNIEGPGVAAGGTAGQVLAKVDATNYNTHWIAASAGGGGTPGGSSGQVQYNNAGAFGGGPFWDSANARLGIGTTAPSVPLSFGTAVADKIRLYDSGITVNDIGIALNSAELAFYCPTMATVRFRNGGPAGVEVASFTGTLATFAASTIYLNGSVGIGTNIPNAPLSFGTGVGTKVLLYDAGVNSYGLGIASNEWQAFAPAAASFAFRSTSGGTLLASIGPAGLTIGTLGGLLKATAGLVSTATAGTDYLTPSGNGSALTGITESQVTGLVSDLAAKAGAGLGKHVFTLPEGNAAVGTDQSLTYGIVPMACTCSKVWVSAKIAPTGAALILDIMKSSNNGSTWTSLWATTPSNRPQLAAASNNGSTTSFDTTALAAGDWLRIDVAQVGSTVAGSGVVAVLATT